MSELSELVGGELPGDLTVEPLVTEVGQLDPASPVAGIGVARLRTDPGLELYALSKISALLATSIKSGRALADLNHFLPFGTEADGDRPPVANLRLSGYAEEVALSLRHALRQAEADSDGATQGSPPTVAVLDSGLSPSFIPHRAVSYLDYSHDGRLIEGTERADPSDHGTRVVKLLDEMLPQSVELVVGRLPSSSERRTSLAIAHALGDLVARKVPDVVNLSVATRAAAFVCPSCRRQIPVPTFLPTMLSLVIRLAGTSRRETVTVMAAGNSGQVSNSRWLNTDLTSLVVAVATNRRGERAKYSGAPEGPLADLFSATAFGGDDPSAPGAVGVFADGGEGTSFAAPFVTAATLAAKWQPSNPTQAALQGWGERVRQVLSPQTFVAVRRV